MYLHTLHTLTIYTLTAGNESCPQPQTSEHLAAIEIMKLKHIIILQNKIDLIRDTQAKDQYQEILKFVQGKQKYILWLLLIIFTLFVIINIVSESVQMMIILFEGLLLISTPC